MSALLFFLPLGLHVCLLGLTAKHEIVIKTICVCDSDEFEKNAFQMEIYSLSAARALGGPFLGTTVQCKTARSLH